jgi:hypothetical protein
MLLTAASYELIVFSSEARGYSMAVFCTLLSFLLLELHFERARNWTFVAYAAAATIGLFSHPVFSTVLASACVWSAVRWWQSNRRSMASVRAAITLQVVPLAALAALYFGDLNHVVSGGGTGTPSLVDAYVQSLAWTFGAPEAAAFKWTAAVIAVAVILAGARAAQQSTPGSAAFFLGAIVVFPNLALVLRGSEMVYTRHFLLGSTLTLLLLAHLLGSLWDRGRGWRLGAAGALLIFAAANGCIFRRSWNADVAITRKLSATWPSAPRVP